MIGQIFVLLLCLAVLPIVFIGYGRLRIEKDYFFMIFLFFVVLYIFVAPALVKADAGAMNAESYLYIQVAIITLFMFPLLLTYRLLRNTMCNTEYQKRVFLLSDKKVILFCLFFIAYEIVFILLALDSHMYFRRIGTEAIAEVAGGLDLYALTVLRTHDLVVLPVIALLAILIPSIKQQMRTWVLILAYLTLVIITCSSIVLALINSRGFLVFLVMALLYAKQVPDNVNIKLPGFFVTLLAVALFYGLIITSNIRNLGIDADATDIMNPVSFVTEADSAVFSKWEWSQRLDCVGLIANMDDSLQRNGYEWGMAWGRPLVAQFGPLVGLELAVEYKTNGITTAKSYLMENHTNIVLKDYPSCMVTDLWGNFWLFGLPVAGILIAIIFVFLRYGLTSASSPVAFVASLIFAFYFVVFEKEFVDWIFGWVKLMPAIALFMILNPIKRISS